MRAPAAPVDDAVRALVGAVYAQALDGGAFTPDWPVCLVDIVLDGLLGRRHWGQTVDGAAESSGTGG